MSILEWLGYGLGAAVALSLAVWLLVRIGSAAFFHTKQQYDERFNHAERKLPRIEPGQRPRS